MERSFGIALSIWAFCLPTLAEDDLHGRHECADARIEAYQRISTQTGLREPQTLGPGGGGIVTGFAEDTDVLHYQIELEVQPSQRWIGGTNAMTVASLVDDLTLFRFRLSDVLEISEVKVGDVAVTWTQIDRETVEVQLDRSYARDEQFVVFVAYSGKPVSDGFGSIEFNGSTQAWTLSETWFAYTWVPLKDELTDKATAELAFIVPKTLIAASNGLLVGTDDLEGDRKRYRWETEYQTATYLFSFSIGNFKTYEKTWTYGELAMPVQFFIYPQNDTVNNRNAWFRVPDMLTVFSDVYGVYPFAREKYGIANFGWGGGMEHQTCTSQGGFSEYLNAHELAHQWWGDNVTCETWHDIWLNEGFATYSEAIWIENEPGKGGKQALINAMLNRKPGSVGDSVYVYDDSNFDRIFSYNYTYLKGGWVLHMLRHVVGDERFFQILREYRAAYEGDVATTADFQAAAEAVYGESLAWFFEQWVYDIGAPIYRYASRKSQAGGLDYLELYIEQGQREDWPVFRMPIDIAATIDGETTVYPVWNVVRKQHYVIPVSGPVDTVAFDPDSWILVSAASGRSFVEGPPKIVTLFPGIDDARRSAEVAAVTVGFHKNVFVAPQDFDLTDPNGEAVEFDLTYDATNFVATLTLKDELGLGRYSLRIADSVKERTKQIALDGEIPGGQITGLPLPSGDGVAGGAALTEFDIVPPLGDLNCDGSADFADIDPFVAAVVDRAAYEQSYPACDWSLADLNGDGGVDFNDIDPFVELLTK